jgi:hypothetical protein
MRTIDDPIDEIDVDDCLDSREFYLINVYAKGSKLNNNHYITEILSLLSEWHSVEVQECTRKPMVHVDNARSYTVRAMIDFFEANMMKRVSHPASSFDLASFDFYLFVYIKECLVCLIFDNRKEWYWIVRDIRWVTQGVNIDTSFILLRSIASQHRVCLESFPTILTNPPFISSSGHNWKSQCRMITPEDRMLTIVMSAQIKPFLHFDFSTRTKVAIVTVSIREQSANFN